MTAPIRTITLYKTEGSADKVYGLTIVAAGELFTVTYMNGPRGGTMRTGLKTNTPVSMEAATKEFEKVMRAKMKDGYTEAQSGEAYTNSPDAGRVSGLRPMLPADLPKIGPENMLRQLIASDDWAAQEKMDGENRPLIIKDGQVRGTNKQGLFVNLPASWESVFPALGDCVLFGEQIGDVYYAFDILELAGVNLKETSFLKRYDKLERLLAQPIPGLQLVKAVTGQIAKQKLLNSIDASKGEGVVFKRLDASFEEGKNTNCYRHKFWEQMTCFVLRINAQRSVEVGATDPDSQQVISLGNVTIPLNQPIPSLSDLLEVRFLYRYQGGSLFQPTSCGVRTDVPVANVTTDQITRIKRKGVPIDLDDETLSEQTRGELARAEFPENLLALKHYLSEQQALVVTDLAKGKEGQFFMDTIQRLANAVHQMPQTGDTDGMAEKAIVHLRYFLGDSEWLITEKDKGSTGDSDLGVQHQAYGRVDGGNYPEAGYISIAEIIGNGGELDFHFEPQTIEDYDSKQTQRCMPN